MKKKPAKKTEAEAVIAIDIHVGALSLSSHHQQSLRIIEGIFAAWRRRHSIIFRQAISVVPPAQI
jgi:hypothetical protein